MKCKEEIVVVGAQRTPFGRFGGSLRQTDIYDLGAAPMKAAIEQAGIAPEQVDEVWWGCGDTTNCKDPYTPVVARQSLLKAGLPATTPSVTLDKACVFAMSAANYAIGDNQSVYADWSMGTSVPTMSAYNNTEQRVDHHTVKRGNPELDITKMHFVNVGYNLSARGATCRCSASTISLPTCLSRITRPRATPW